MQLDYALVCKKELKADSQIWLELTRNLGNDFKGWQSLSFKPKKIIEATEKLLNTATRKSETSIGSSETERKLRSRRNPIRRKLLKSTFTTRGRMRGKFAKRLNSKRKSRRRPKPRQREMPVFWKLSSVIETHFFITTFILKTCGQAYEF